MQFFEEDSMLIVNGLRVRQFHFLIKFVSYFSQKHATPQVSATLAYSKRTSYNNRFSQVRYFLNPVKAYKL